MRSCCSRWRAPPPAAARRFAERSGCREHGLEMLDDALLLISELVTNSVLHGGPPIVLAVDCDGDGPARPGP